ncbi:MAG TPA: SRPBCC family protein [Thermodesulfobacteriota bacterium]|nr:SRPBCC family protein [Thermodesulfobacteriota bacterium]
MTFVQRRTLAVERPRLWEFLMDVPAVARCLPGVEGLEAVDETTYRGTLRIQVGPVRLALEGTLAIEARDREGWRASLRADARDRRLGGGVRARMAMTLRPAGEGRTELVVETDLSVLGKIGEFGQPVIRKKADALLETFAANVEAALAG